MSNHDSRNPRVNSGSINFWWKFTFVVTLDLIAWYIIFLGLCFLHDSVLR